jgi:uncharacterized membrane protein (UPF0127 family)
MGRLDTLPLVVVPGVGPVREARTYRARLLGLARLAEPPPEPLLLPRCRSVHTYGMRFALDLLWLGAGARIVRIDRAVPPRAVRRCRGAHGVVEAAAQPVPSDR